MTGELDRRTKRNQAKRKEGMGDARAKEKKERERSGYSPMVVINHRYAEGPCYWRNRIRVTQACVFSPYTTLDLNHPTYAQCISLLHLPSLTGYAARASQPALMPHSTFYRREGTDTVESIGNAHPCIQ